MGQQVQAFDAQVAKANQEVKDAEEANRRAAQEAQPIQVVVPQYSGTHAEWMASAGISASDWQYVDYIVSNESGWNYDATNASSGAHGLVQALPYSKTGCGWDDPICQLSWGDSYAKSRYGSWYGAYIWWTQNHWW